jgi:hypothetical protein
VKDGSGDLAKKVAATAARLRLAQADLADEAADIRREHLREEVTRAVSELGGAERGAFVAALLERFPTFEQGVQPQQAAPDRSAYIAELEAELNDPRRLAQRLARMAPSMSPEDRRAVGATLVESGLAPRAASAPAPAPAPAAPAAPVASAQVTAGPGSDAALPEFIEKLLREKLRLAPDKKLDARRLFELGGILGASAARLDTVLWEQWQQASPASRWHAKRGETIGVVLSRFITGGPVTPAVLAAKAEDNLRLIGGCMLALRKTPETFPGTHLQRFSPESIMAEARKQAGAFVSAEKVAWGLYSKRMEESDEAAMGEVMRAEQTRHADSLVQ